MYSNRSISQIRHVAARRLSILFVWLLAMAFCVSTQAQTAGDFDPSFDMSVGADGGISTILPLEDGRILVGGDFLNIQGQSIPFLARLNNDGSIDNTFNTGTGPSSSVREILPYGSDQFIICGSFSVYDGEAHNGIAVINNDGSIDSSFPYVIGLTALTIEAMALQPDGKIIVGGEISAPYNGIVRIDPNGTIDASFNPGTGIWAPSSPTVYDILVRGTSIVFAGNFNEYDGNAVGRVVQVLSNGTYDISLNNSGVGSSGIIFDIEEMPFGQMLLSGAVNTYDGNTSNGTVLVATDLGYTLPALTGTGFGAGVVLKAHRLSNGKILAVGSFTNYSVETANGIIRLNSDFTVDPSFDSGTGTGDVYTLEPTWDGRLLNGGNFASYDGNTATRMARIYSDSCVSRLTGSVTLNGQPVTDGKVYVYTEHLQWLGYQRADSADIVNGEYVFDGLPEFAFSYILQAVPDISVYPETVAIPTFFSPEGPSHEWNNPLLTYSLNSTCGHIDTVDITVLAPEAEILPPGTGSIAGQLRWAENKMPV
jgi:uncharacterized delta-60 repeat protein